MLPWPPERAESRSSPGEERRGKGEPRPGENQPQSVKGGGKDRHKGCSQQDILSLEKPSQVPTNPLDRLAVSSTSLLRAI